MLGQADGHLAVGKRIRPPYANPSEVIVSIRIIHGAESTEQIGARLSKAGLVALGQQRQGMKGANSEVLRRKPDCIGQVGGGSLWLATGDAKCTANAPTTSVIRPRADDLVECGLGLVPLSPLDQDTTRAIGSVPNGIGSSFGPPGCLRRTTPLLKLLAALPPGRGVERLERAVFRVEGQPGEDLYPGGDPIEVVRQFGSFSEQPHRLIVASGQEILPSGLKATVTTWSGCGMGGPRGIPEAASQSRTFPPNSPVSTTLPSGLNATANTMP